MTRTTTTQEQERHPWRVALITREVEDEPVAAKVPRLPRAWRPKKLPTTETSEDDKVPTMLECQEGAVLPKWMLGPTTAQNTVRRKKFLIEKFDLGSKPCLQQGQAMEDATEILLELWETFSFDGAFGRTTLLKHSIRLKEHQRPINQRYRPVNPGMEKDLKNQLTQWEKHKVIEKSRSPWNFALVAAAKKNGKTRWCVDFRPLNAVTVTDSHPIGNIEDNLARLARSKIFSGLDGTGAFHVVDLEEEDKEKTSFATPFGSYQFRQLPFGLCGGPSTYARLVDMVLDGIPFDVALPYLDDTVVHSATVEEHH